MTSVIPTQQAPEQCGATIPRGTIGRSAFMLVKVGAVLADLADETLAVTGVDARGYCILATLAVDGPDSQHELAGLLGLAPGVVVAAIDELEAGGFVQRNRDPHDRRRSRVTLTTHGQKTLAAADTIADDAVAQVLTGLDGSELEQLQALLSRGLSRSIAGAAA